MSTKKIKSEHSPDGWQIIDEKDFDPNQHELYVEPDEAAEAEAKAKAEKKAADEAAKKAKADEKAAAEAAEKERLAKEAEEKKAAEGEGKSDAPVATRKKVS